MIRHFFQKQGIGGSGFPPGWNNAQKFEGFVARVFKSMPFVVRDVYVAADRYRMFLCLVVYKNAFPAFYFYKVRKIVRMIWSCGARIQGKKPHDDFIGTGIPTDRDLFCDPGKFFGSDFSAIVDFYNFHE